MMNANKENIMSNTWKWILGIVLVVVLTGAMFAIGYFWQSQTYNMMPGLHGAQYFGPVRSDDNWQHPTMGFHSDRFPMTRDNFFPFGGFFMLGGLVKWLLFFGLLYGAYWLGRRNARITLDPSTSPTKPAAPAAPPEA